MGEPENKGLVDTDSGNVILSSTIPHDPQGTTARGMADRGSGGDLFEELDGFSDDTADNAMGLDNSGQEDGMPSKSLVVGEGTEATRVHDNISKVTMDHEAVVVRLDQAYEHCNDHHFHLIWIVADLPSNKEALSLSAFIRYVSKKNQNTTVIGVTLKPSRVDHRIDGVDEILPRPVTKAMVRKIYVNWTSIQLLLDGGDSDEDDQSSLHTLSMPTTPATLSTPTTPASACDETDRSSFSISEDSGIESPPTFQLPVNQLSNIASIRNLIGQSRSQASKMKAADHTTKEKLRRERIKDSCDQLRVLLPYIRGRKTDMASIMEMCVDYLQIVNAFMPQSLQDQIVDILSKDPSLVPNKDAGRQKKGKKDAKPVGDIVMSQNTPTGDSIQNPTLSQCPGVPTNTPRKPSGILFLSEGSGPSKPQAPKRELCSSYDTKPTKRIRTLTHSADSLLGEVTACSSYDTGMQSIGVQPLSQYDGRTDGSGCGLVRDDIGQLSYSFHTTPLTHCHGKSYTDIDNTYSRIYGSGTPHSETYAPSHLYNNYVTAKSQTLERDSFSGMYMDNSLFPYYGSLHSNTGSHLYSGHDYVNPNSVLPSYNPTSTSGSRLKSDTLKAESTGSLSVDSRESDIISPGSPP